MKESPANKKLTLKTTPGCWRIFSLCLVIILLASLAAHLIATDGGRVKISHVTFDARGATMDADLLYPAGTTDQQQLPAVIVTHGAGCERGVTRGIAQELARRGFVVLNVSAYGASTSEFPAYDEVGMGVETYNARETPGGLLDALNYVRTLQFVDQTRIGLVGHSQGSRRTSMASAQDCGYLSFNDIMINVLYETFGQTFTEAEISQNADTLAQNRLNEDQLAHYQTIRAEKWANYNTRVRAECLIGGDGSLISPIQTVEVAGYDVQRNCQTNLGLINGTWDNYANFNTLDTTLEAWHLQEAAISDDWYVLDDLTQSSTNLGDFKEISIATDSDLQQAIANRTTRLIAFNQETHAKNFFSNQTATDVVRFFSQTLNYNCGNLTDTATTPLSANNCVFMWRALFNAIAMTAMLIMLVPLAGILLSTKFFAPCVAQNRVTISNGGSKRNFWLFGGISILLGFIAIYSANKLFSPLLPSTKFLPLFANWYITLFFLSISGGCCLVLLFIYWLLDHKNDKHLGFSALNVLRRPAVVAKTILLAVALLAAGFAAFRMIDYLFGEDFRFWVSAFTAMKVEQWGLVWRYSLITFPMLLAMSASINYAIRQDLPEWKNTLYTVFVSSAGVWLCYLVNNLCLMATNTAFCSWESSYSILFLAPITTWLARKFYRLTNSIWLGALTNSLLISWTLISSVGNGTYVAQDFFSNFFNI